MSNQNQPDPQSHKSALKQASTLPKKRARSRSWPAASGKAKPKACPCSCSGYGPATKTPLTSPRGVNLRSPPSSTPSAMTAGLQPASPLHSRPSDIPLPTLNPILPSHPSGHTEPLSVCSPLALPRLSDEPHGETRRGPDHFLSGGTLKAGFKVTENWK